MKRRKANPKNLCWDTFSKMIRTRDCIRTTGCPEWGLCITCGKRYHFKLLQAGHFVAGRHLANLFSEKGGVHAQCYNCNINLKGNSLKYRRRIIELYGEGYDLILEQEAEQRRSYAPYEYEALTATFKDMTAHMIAENTKKQLFGHSPTM